MFAAGKIGRITPAGVITEFAIPTPFSGPRALAAGPDGNIWFSEFHASKIGRITMDGVVTEFTLPRPDSGPGDITAGADGNIWFVELNGTIDGRFVTGNRVGRITMRGEITEFAIPSPTGSPTNVAVGPDRNVWYTKGAALGRVTPDGVITEFPLAEQRARRRAHGRQRSSAAAADRESALVRRRQRQQDQLPALRIEPCDWQYRAVSASVPGFRAAFRHRRPPMRYIPLSLVSLALAACSPPDATTTSAAAPTSSTEAPALQTDQDKTLYALGLAIGQNVRETSDFKLTADEARRSSSDGLTRRRARRRAEGRARRLRPADPGARRGANVGATPVQRKQRPKLGLRSRRRCPEPSAAPTGVVIIPMTEGTGANPTATSTVRVHYHGTLRDGTVFDSSVQRGEPISFPLNGVISCWTEGVQKIKVGGKAKLVCPADTAYGDQGSGSIPGGAALAFEVELLAIE